jgi:hypothetical protein
MYPMMTLYEFCAPGFIARRQPSKVISWDTLYLVFKDRFSVFRRPRRTPSCASGLDAAGVLQLPGTSLRESSENRIVNEES